MMKLLVKWLAYATLIVLVSYVVPGFLVENLLSAMIVWVVILLINVFIKPLILLLTLPVNILTLGTFRLIINALLLMLAGYIAPGFEVVGFLSAFFGAIFISIGAFIISKF